jgi:hypothetical protein
MGEGLEVEGPAVEVPISPKTRSIFVFSLGFRSISQRNTLLRGVSLTLLVLTNRMSFEVLVAARVRIGRTMCSRIHLQENSVWDERRHFRIQI